MEAQTRCRSRPRACASPCRCTGYGRARVLRQRTTSVAYGATASSGPRLVDAVAFDLAGITAAANTAAAAARSSNVIGVIDQVTSDGASSPSPTRSALHRHQARRRQRVAIRRCWRLWQMSVGIFPDRIEELPEPAPAPSSTGARSPAARASSRRPCASQLRRPRHDGSTTQQTSSSRSRARPPWPCPSFSGTIMSDNTVTPGHRRRHRPGATPPPPAADKGRSRARRSA